MIATNDLLEVLTASWNAAHGKVTTNSCVALFPTMSFAKVWPYETKEISSFIDAVAIELIC